MPQTSYSITSATIDLGIGFSFAAADRSGNQISTSIENNGDTYRINWDGNTAFNVTDHSLIVELTFYRNNMIQIVFSTPTTLSAPWVSSGTTTSTFTPMDSSHSYVLYSTDNGNTWDFTQGSVDLV